MSTCFFAHYVNFPNKNTGVTFSTVCWNGHKSLTYHLGSWLLTAIHPDYLLPVIDSAVRMHLMSSHCGGSSEMRFIIAAKTYDPINIPSTFWYDDSFQWGKHLFCQTYCDEVFRLAVHNTKQSSLYPTTNNASKRWTMVTLSDNIKAPDKFWKIQIASRFFTLLPITLCKPDNQLKIYSVPCSSLALSLTPKVALPFTRFVVTKDFIRHLAYVQL